MTQLRIADGTIHFNAGNRPTQPQPEPTTGGNSGPHQCNFGSATAFQCSMTAAIKLLVVIAAIACPFSTCRAFESKLAVWSHELETTRFSGDAPSTQRVMSGIFTGYKGFNATVRFSQDLQIVKWGKPHKTSARYQRTDELDRPKYEETLKVTLWEMKDTTKMKATFEHVVYKNGKLHLRFAGTTILVRWNAPP